MNVDEEKKMRGWRDTKTIVKRNYFSYMLFRRGGGEWSSANFL